MVKTQRERQAPRLLADLTDRGIHQQFPAESVVRQSCVLAAFWRQEILVAWWLAYLGLRRG
jgi:hypothetical protein